MLRDGAEEVVGFQGASIKRATVLINGATILGYSDVAELLNPAQRRRAGDDDLFIKLALHFVMIYFGYQLR